MTGRIVGIMGPGESAPEHVTNAAYALGNRFAQTGGRDHGVMHEALRGANGTTIGIIPGEDRTGMSPYVDIPIITGLGSQQRERAHR